MTNQFTQPVFFNADKAFRALYDQINEHGLPGPGGTKRLFNVGFYITNPNDSDINTVWRKWSKRYAEREWEWYKSGNRSVEDLKKYAPIWDRMHNGDNIVNSNYGYQWMRNGQLEKIKAQLKENEGTRQAFISIYDGKEKDDYSHDTPCTLNIGFSVNAGQLNMTVLMRSNDLWFGFCNDQFCFAKLHELLAEELELEQGWYYHFAHDMHIYPEQLRKN